MQNEQNQKLNSIPPPAPQQPIVEPEKSSFLSSKWLKIGIGFAVIILVLSFTFVLGKNSSKPKISEINQTSTVKFSPTPASNAANATPNPTAGWKMYKDSLSGIEFKYPTTWTAKSFPDSSTSEIYLESHDFTICNGCEFSTSIQMGLSQEKNFETKLKNIKDSFNTTDSIVKNITVGGKNAVQITGTLVPGYYPEGHFSSYVLVDLDNKTLDISLDDKQSSDIFTKVISSIKFDESAINSTPTPTTDPILSWKKYGDVNYPFRIQYPKEWNLRTTYGKSVNNTNNDRVAGIDVSSNPTYGSTLVVNVIDPRGKKLNEWMKTVRFDAPPQPNYTYQGIPSYRFTYTQNEKNDGVELYYAYKDKVIFLAWNVYSYDQETADKIMSTLKLN